MSFENALTVVMTLFVLVAPLAMVGVIVLSTRRTATPAAHAVTLRSSVSTRSARATAEPLAA